MENITQFITHKLKVNEAKSAVAPPQERKFLGFSFTGGLEVKRTIAFESSGAVQGLNSRDHATGQERQHRVDDGGTGPVHAGLAQLFGFCETPEVLIYLTRWSGCGFPAALWRQWKTPRRRRAALLQLGIRPRLASNTAGSGRGPWYLAWAKALSVGLSNAYLKSLGLLSLFEEC